MVKMVVAPRATSTTLPQDWQQQLGQMSGVRVHGSTPQRLQATFSPAALQEAKARFQQDLIFEEAAPVSFPE